MVVRFEKAPPLPDWLAPDLPFSRRVAVVDGRRIHFVEQGAGPAVLLMHGNPTWSYLWRKVIDRLDGRVRAIAPDLLGFGLSDKPRRVGDYDLPMQVRAMAGLVEGLDIDELTVVGQDWGGPVAAGVGERLRDRIRGMVWANTAVLRPARPIRSKPFHRFSRLPLLSDLVFRVGAFPIPVMDRVQGDKRSIGLNEKRAYLWPLRRLRDRTAPLALARMVPSSEDHPTVPVMDRIGSYVAGFDGPIELVWGTEDPILGRSLRRHVESMPEARVTETNAGHFLQEEVPDALAMAILRVSGVES